MYTILVNEDHSLITTKKERIMQRSKNVNSLCFLIKPQLNDIDIQSSTVIFEYVTPISHKYDNFVITPAAEQSNGYLQFMIPFTPLLTGEAGELQVQLSFLYVDLDSAGNSVEQVKKTSIAKINILPLAAWSDYIPDSGLTAIDQRILKTEAQLRAMIEMGEMPVEDKADDFSYDPDTNILQLTSNNKPIGTAVKLNGANLEDGVPVVDFSNTPETPDDDNSSSSKEDNDVVEF